MEKALIYCRVSTEEQAGEGRYSIQTQLDLSKKAILASTEYELAEDGVYKDLGKTARNTNRPALQELLVRVQEDERVGAVYVLDTDRLARNMLDHLSIKALLKRKGVKLISVNQPGLDESIEGEVQDGVIALINQYQSQITSRKTIKSMEQRFRDGWWVTKVPVGYLNAGAPDNPDKRIIILDEMKGSLITELFQRYSTGSYSMLELGEELKKKGLVSRTGGMLSVANLLRLIRNPFYYGIMRWREMEQIGKHPPLTTKDIFDRCQEVCDDHNHHACRRRKYDFLLRGYIFSSVSGLRFIGETHPKKDKTYYRPYLTSKQKPGIISDEDRSVRAADIEIAVEELFTGIEFSPEFIEKLLTRVQFIYDLKKRDVIREKRKILAVKSSAEQKLAVAEEKLVSGILDDSDFTRIKLKQREAIYTCDEELIKLEKSRNIKVDTIQQIVHLAKNIGQSYQEAPPELKRIYISLFWERFEVANRKLVTAVPSPVIEALVASGTICFSNKHKPVPHERMFAQKNKSFRDTIRIRNIRGGYRESNPDCKLHKLEC
ncbi:MAG: Recombinase [Parcubacteria group bacterium]|nr:Recombinase [Parcubacteria group bacterium]